MGAEIWIRENTRKLTEKTVAITGATGGLGRALCRYVLMLEGRCSRPAVFHVKNTFVSVINTFYDFLLGTPVL